MYVKVVYNVHCVHLAVKGALRVEICIITIDPIIKGN